MSNFPTALWPEHWFLRALQQVNTRLTNCATAKKDATWGAVYAKPVAAVNGALREAVISCDVQDQALIDAKLCEADGTRDKSRFGANAILAVSIAVSKAAAASQQLELHAYINRIFSALCGEVVEPSIPLPMFNVINGGAHASNKLELQEFMIRPVGAQDTGPAVRIACEVYHSLRKVCLQRGYGSLIGDEGGFAPEVDNARQALDLLAEAARRAGHSLGDDIDFALDPAASEIFTDGTYQAPNEGAAGDSQTMIDLYTSLCKEYPIASIEDGLDQDDIEGWKSMTKAMGDKVQLVGDDVFVTSSARLAQGIAGGYANAILVKINQAGSLSETLECIAKARGAGYATVISHRSGDTEDTAIADIAVGTGAGQLKAGAPARSERTAKFNRLIEIAATSNIPFAGRN